MAKKAKKRAKKAAQGGKRRGGWNEDEQAAWQEAVPRVGGGNLPLGEHIVLIDNIVIEEYDGVRTVVWDLRIPEGEYAGRKGKKFSRLANKENMDWFKGEMDTLELQIPDDIDDLGDALDEGVGISVRIDVTEGKAEWKNRYNIYFRERLEGNGNGDEEEPDAGDEYTRKDIEAMDEKALTALAKELTLDPDEYETWDELAEQCCVELGIE